MLKTTNYSWCEQIILLLTLTICGILLLDYNFSVLPIHGIYLFAYLFLVLTSSSCVTFVLLQRILKNNNPYEYDFDRNTSLKLLGYLYNALFVRERAVHRAEGTKGERSIKSIDERIDTLVRDIQVRFILKWYLNVSSDATFLSESKLLIDDVIRRFLQVVIDVNGRKLAHGCSTIFLRHVKEYRKALKRSRRSSGTVDDLYRYAHVGSKSKKSADYFVYQLTSNVLRQFVNWELWNSLPCQSVVSILSRRFTSYVLTFVSTPGYLNYKIVETFASESVRASLQLDRFAFISISDVDHGGSLDQLRKECLEVKETVVERLIKEESLTPKVSPKRNVKDVDEADCANESQTVSEADACQTGPQPKPTEPVKIYESKSISNKTWRNSSDLECISLGQDLLAFQEFNDPDTQIQQLIEKKLWKDNADTVDEEKTSSSWDLTEGLFVEQENVNEPAANFQNYIKSTANHALKPIGDVTASTLHNMKELQQTTVNNVVKPVSQATTNAMHKIGDLQDEAAGVVEGILDFGIAGLRKGLKLTGLQENFTEFTQKAKSEFHDLHKTMDIQTGKISEAIKIIDPVDSKHKTKLVKTPRITSEDKTETLASHSDSDESVWVNPLTKDSPSFDGDILLERTPDAPKSIVSEAAERAIPQITEEPAVEGSPDPEYEDTQDLATTIAKLRSLLAQKSESGFTTPSLSPMPQEEVMKTPLEPDPTKTDGAMPSLYKFCARTATGVFQNTLNTIKTALPGNANDAVPIQVPCTNGEWTFVEGDSSSDDFNSRMKKLLSERQAYCTIDTAYEAIHSLEVADQADLGSPIAHFEDELDDFDVHVPITKVLVDVIVELLGDTKICLLQETVVKALLLFVGYYTEEHICRQSDNLLHNINKFVGKLPDAGTEDVTALKLDEMVKICAEQFPSAIRKLLGEQTVNAAVSLFLTSLQSQRINQDIFMQVFELFASELINACSQASPAYSA
ncbi:hypothetical protein PPYR_03379 [Photinus pyralis]|uniref:PXA domain-containing protein n=3 Tax=Photinus pyralis TaxID=7054 RepID=A0A5N4A2S7_PHOPY|nr:uncharacterized protein LOC116161635 [Photinus pyralis]KAB0791579.1 hypothetical protein PPYR_03379 [Photinus pyralis]